jgi:hypothetical protein
MRVFAWLDYCCVFLVSTCGPKGSSLCCHGLILLEFSGSLQLLFASRPSASAWCTLSLRPATRRTLCHDQGGGRGGVLPGNPVGLQSHLPNHPPSAPPLPPSRALHYSLSRSAVTQFNYLAIIPQTLSSPSRLLLAPPVAEPAPILVLDSLRNLGGEPLPPRKPWEHWAPIL